MHTHSILRLLAIALLVGTLTGVATPAAAQSGAGYLPGEVVVKLRVASDLGAVARQYGLDPRPIDQFGARPNYRLRIADGADPETKAAALARDSRVQYAEPNFIGQAPEVGSMTSWSIGGSAGEYAGQWAAERIRLAQAHALSRGAGVTVAVLDTGVDRAHPALAGRLVDGFDFVDLDADPSEVGARPQDRAYGHGTHVAGLVALVAPQARIMPVRVLDRSGMGNIWVLAEGLARAADPDGNRTTADGADVINLSLGTTRRTNLLDDVLRMITCTESNDDPEEDECMGGRRGRVATIAAGNTGNSTPIYPAAEKMPDAIVVAASTRADRLATFSTFGGWVQMAAPGEATLSSVPGGYGSWSGTSMAAPLAAGTAALLRSLQPGYNAADIESKVVGNGQSIDGPVPKRLNAEAALR